MRKRNPVLLLAVAAATAQTCGIGMAAANADAAWKRAGADEGLHRAFHASAYSLEDSGHETWRGVNHAQRFALEFDRQEVRMSHPGGSVSFHLAGYGYGGQLRKPARARLTGHGDRVEYQRGDLTEWYINGPQGLEQGFDLARRLAIGHQSGPLTIVLDVGGELRPAAEGEGGVLFESRHGIVLRYSGLKALDAGGRILPSRMEVRDREIRVIVEDRGAEYPLVIDPTWTQQQELTASDGAAGDRFGTSVSASGDTAVIGAPARNGGKGAVYVFVRSGGVWTLQQELSASDGAVGDSFGASVSVYGDTAVIGAYGKSSLQGAAYVFVRGAGVWTQQTELTASDGAAGDLFGSSVSVSADTAVIGAHGKGSSQGAAYVFVGSNGVWSQRQELTVSNGAANDSFGISVAVSGDVATVGAPGANSIHGAAYVFASNNGVWSQQQELTASDGAVNDGFGNSVSLSGYTAEIGAPGRNGDQGAAYVYVFSGGTWSQQPELTASDGAAGDRFGSSVSLSGDTAAIGAPGRNTQGATYIFVGTTGTWTEQQEPAASDGAASDNFGAVSLSGDSAVIGAFAHNSLAGAAYVFARTRLGTNALLVGSVAGTSSVALSFSGPWTAVANDSFLHISTGSAGGTDSALVVFTYDAFTGTGARTGTLTVAGLTVTVTQAGTNYIAPGGEVALVSSGLNVPTGVAVDGSGNVYIADMYNNAIEEWSASTQQVTTLVSSGLNFPADVAVDSFGNVYIADENDNAIEEWSAAAQQVTTLVPATSGLSYPTGVAVDSFGNVYIADENNNAIKEWSASTQQVTTLVSSGLNWPAGVAVDSLGNVYIADENNNAIKEWSPSTQQVTTLVSSGLNYPTGVAVDGSGNVYIVDGSEDAIKEWSPATRQVTTLASSGLRAPQTIAIDSSGDAYIADSGHNAIKEIPNVFVGPPSLAEPATGGTDVLLPVLPSTTPLTGIYAPTSDQTWLTIGTIADGVIPFSFTANTSSARTANITVLGQPIAVTQTGVASPAQIITFGPIASQMLDAQPFTVSASASSGLPVSFNSQTPPVCTVSGSAVTLYATGICTLQATQAGNATWAAAPSVSRNVQVTVSPCDLNGSTTAVVADAQAIINEALGVTATVDDLNLDGVVNAVDVQIVVNAALRLGCSFSQ